MFRPAVGDRGGLGGGEQPAVALGFGLLAGRGGHLLEHAGHREQDRGAEGGELRGQLAGIGEETDPPAVVHQAQGDHPGQDVGQGQEEQAGGAFRQHALTDPWYARDGADRLAQVAVADHAAFRPSRGPRRVHDGRERRRGHRSAAAVDLPGGDALPGRGQRVQAAAVDLPHRFHLRRLRGPDALGAPRVPREYGDRARVGQDPADLLHRRGLIDGDGHGSGRPDREVAHHPVQAGGRHQANPVTRLDPGGDQAGGDRGDPVGKLFRRHRLPCAVNLSGEHCAVRISGGPFEDVIARVVAHESPPVSGLCHGSSLLWSVRPAQGPRACGGTRPTRSNVPPSQEVCPCPGGSPPGRLEPRCEEATGR